MQDLRLYHDYRNLHFVLQEGAALLKGDVHQTIVNTLTIYTLVVCFVRMSDSVPWRSSGSIGGPAKADWSEAHQGNQGPTKVIGHRRFLG
jgi:hypothetical protein